MNNSNTVRNTLKVLAVAMVTVVAFGCSKDDDGPNIEAPTLSYSDSDIEATFHQSGNSAAPVVNWNGEEGTFSLTSAAVSGISIDENTGVISWENILSWGEHAITVTATNSAGSSSATVTLNNPFQGTFTGSYDWNYNGEIGTFGAFHTEMKFHLDGKVTGNILNVITMTGQPLAGNWEIIDDEIYIEYVIDPADGTDRYSIAAEITITEETVRIGTATRTATIYEGFDATPGTEVGDISIGLQQD